jgi:hypothetical protein
MTSAMGARCGSGTAILAVAILLALLAPGGAGAATVVNGGFEAGTLKGWQVHRVIQAGNWFAYKGTDAPIGSKRGADPVQPPPQGAYAAIADQANPDTLILYQDIALEAGSDYQLSLLAYYDSYAPIAVPTPDTLSIDEAILGGQKNQQYRIDLMKPGAPLESLDPADILRTLLRTTPGDPKKLPPTELTADLGPFAGQTVRLRIANAVHEEVFNAGVDAVSLSSPDSPGSGNSPSGGGSKPHASNRLSLGKAVANRKNGTAVLSVHVPDPGLLTARGKSLSPLVSGARAHGSKNLRKATKPVTVKIARAGTIKVRLKPTPPARAILKQSQKLRVKVTVTFKPTGGSQEAASLPVVLRLKPRP